MNIREEKMDLFYVPQGYYLAHCINADFALGAGIAKQFDAVFNMKLKLNYQYESGVTSIGNALLIDNVFNLVTKDKHYHKPTYDKLRETLEDMLDQMNDLLITKLAMPLIGCGLDRLEWDDVYDIILDVFEDTDIEILICQL